MTETLDLKWIIRKEGSKEIMNVKCDCGNSIKIEGNKEGWELCVIQPIIFRCPCGKKHEKAGVGINA